MTGSPRDDGQLQYLAIARVVAPHGVQGKVRADILSDFPHRFAHLETVYLGRSYRAYRVESAQPHRNQTILKLAGIDTMEAAARLRGDLVYVPVEEAVPLPAGQYYWHEIIGLEVQTGDGRLLGRVTDILHTGSNDVYVVQGERGEILVPAIEDVVRAIDLPHGRMVIELIPGMLD